ncbi:MAG: Phosphopantetheinyl transferase component of siderophore synthetase [Roseibaca calidilacus]|uniref:Enterobactin synthase component D n=1 Tax=Roseibaca calidilacus TaxID=1666912 RepID=A0A0P7WU59_9RHOB|nr:4'-phosphopantetheinyl transferase superfamily protein [Roseibaca calidilacus]KPP91010.1 MAG: Phosphopantetheinyl transferase component of siderophore synthetase [Roseibaca calidilacus]CUX83968.1 4'-phosphopantetheinyl transferase EntD (siderophore biosynthesis) [Roseibaca calidilacus]
MIQQRFSFSEFARPLFSDRVAMAWADPTAPMPRLIGDEVLAVEQVRPVRAREFGAGRAAAREAMGLLGHPPRPVLQGEDRAPVWPRGLTGSISHTARDCMAVVTDAPEIRALGLDIEMAAALEPALWPEICTMAEMRWLASLGPSQRGHFAKLVFSAKEAVYKAQYTVSRQMLGFQDLTLTVDLPQHRFTAELTTEVAGFAPGAVLQGRFAILGAVFITAVEISADDPALSGGSNS